MRLSKPQLPLKGELFTAALPSQKILYQAHFQESCEKALVTVGIRGSEDPMLLYQPRHLIVAPATQTLKPRRGKALASKQKKKKM